MAVKFFTVVLFFMHIKFDNKIFGRLFYIGLGLAVFVYIGRPLHLPLLLELTACGCTRVRAERTDSHEHEPGQRRDGGRLWAWIRGASSGTPRCGRSSAFLVGSYTYLVRVIGPSAVRAGEQPITRRNIWCFVAAMAMLWTASDWPIHDIGERYLYSAHMLQHMMLSYFLPPLALLATPEWLFRALIGSGRVYRALRWLCHPVAAGLLFNVSVMVEPRPGIVNASIESSSPVLHYSLHLMVVTMALLMWMPVCGPIPEFHIGTGVEDDLPLPPVGGPDRAGGVADVRRGRRLPPVRRAAGAGVGAVGHRGPAARGRDHR